MAMNFEADLDAILNVDEFADVVSLPNGSKVNGILDLNPIVLTEGETEISTNTQLLMVKTSTFCSVGQGDEVIINNVKYAVSDIRPDGTGMDEVTLHKV